MYFASEYVFRMQFKAPIHSSGLEGATFTHIHMHLCCLWSSDVEEQERKCSALSETTLSSLTHEHCRYISSLPVSIYTSASSVTQWATARRENKNRERKRVRDLPEKLYLRWFALGHHSLFILLRRRQKIKFIWGHQSV